MPTEHVSRTNRFVALGTPRQGGALDTHGSPPYRQLVALIVPIYIARARGKRSQMRIRNDVGSAVIGVSSPVSGDFRRAHDGP